jgi:hypothetical protein
LQRFAVVGHGVEEFRDVLVHEFDVCGFGGRCRKVTLQ